MSLWATWTRICQARGVQSSRSLIVPDVKNGYDLRRRSRWVSAAECNSYQLFRLRCRIKNTRLGTLGWQPIRGVHVGAAEAGSTCRSLGQDRKRVAAQRGARARVPREISQEKRFAKAQGRGASCHVQNAVKQSCIKLKFRLLRCSQVT